MANKFFISITTCINDVYFRICKTYLKIAIYCNHQFLENLSSHYRLLIFRSERILILDNTFKCSVRCVISILSTSRSLDLATRTCPHRKCASNATSSAKRILRVHLCSQRRLWIFINTRTCNRALVLSRASSWPWRLLSRGNPSAKLILIVRSLSSDGEFINPFS